MDDGAIVVIAFFIAVCFICWCGCKSTESPDNRTEVLKEIIKSLSNRSEPISMWSCTTTKRMRKVRRNKLKNKQAEGE